ncbi:preprotein translocase subunit SecA [Georgenia sp. Z1344]|uniref:preprotein translocase subunit SecA n=1 Tax=Georgenia sp. Z1344 TaxID=3416706 RepID=UPI003CEEDAF5
MGEGRVVKRLGTIADQVDLLEDSFVDLTDEELKEQTTEFRERLEDGETLDDILPEAFAVVREAARRVLGQRHYRVQIMGGAALHQGNIAEMKTGEGKTLVATLPSYLNALEGKGVHVVTVNDYLASYQSELMGRVHRFLGLTTGCILSGQTPAQRREMYAADITYGTNNEFGFDYLRDNMALSTDDLVQRGHNFVIVDEVDSILIDEARTPLIISGPAEGDVNPWYAAFAKIAPKLEVDVDYDVDEKKRTIGILEPGIEKVEDLLGIDNLYESLNTPLISFLNNSLRAKELYQRDKDYIVEGGEVTIVDEHTGRRLRGRRYNEGMHQAIEAKEGVKIKAENQTLATITLQNYFRLYDTLSGMTGTAETEAAEFSSTYKIGVVPIPPNKPMIRKDEGDLVYKNIEQKYKAIVADVKERHETGQPVLLGTTSVEKSERLSELLSEAGVAHDVLNAKQHEREAAIVSEAGRKGAVTVATNMAGRGTDIMLGGNPEHIAQNVLRDRGLDPTENAEEYEAAWAETLEAAQEQVKDEHQAVLDAGGLYVLGTERHESRRIDNQLRGRAGRQGDPGESRFYLSLEDDLMRLFGSGPTARLMDNASYPDDMALEHKWVSSGIRRAQEAIEARNFEQRKNVLKYDDVMNKQRTVIYEQRRRVLHGEDIEDQVRTFASDLVDAIVDQHAGGGAAEDSDLDAILGELGAFYPVSVTEEDLVDQAGHRDRVTPELLRTELRSDISVAYDTREEEVGEDLMRRLERRVVLSVLDRHWRENLYEMDYLRQGIQLRAAGQRDPLVEYQREGFTFFQAMNEAIREDTVRYVFNLEIKPAGQTAVDASSAAATAVSAAGRATAAPRTGAAAPRTGTGTAATQKAAAAGSAFAASALGGATPAPPVPGGGAAAGAAIGARGAASASASTSEDASSDAGGAPEDSASLASDDAAGLAPDAAGLGEDATGDADDAPAGEGSGATPTDDELLGLDAPRRPTGLTYSGTSSATSGADDDAPTRRPARGGDSAADGDGGADGLNRAQRRAQAKKARKRG